MKRLNIIGNRKEYSVKNLKFDYDKLNDLLYVYKTNSSVYSTVIIGKFHIEVNKGGEIVGIEVLRASETLGEYKISQKSLENIQKIELKSVTRNNSSIIFLVIKSLNEEKSATITMNNLDSPIMQAIGTA